MIKALIGIIIGIGLIILGLVLIAVPTTGWDGTAINSGFKALQTLNVVTIFQQEGVGLTVKMGVVLAVYVGPAISILGLVGFFIWLFLSKKK